MQPRTSNELASAIVKLAAVEALPLLLNHLVIGNLVSRRFEPSAGILGERVAFPVCDNADHDVQIEVGTRAEEMFEIPDLAKVLAVPELLNLYMQPAVLRLAERIETDLLSLYSQFTSNAPVGFPGIQLTEETIDRAGSRLFDAKVQPNAARYLVVDSVARLAVKRLSRFCEVSSKQQREVVGTIKNFRIVPSKLVPTTGSGPIATHNLAFAAGAIGMVVRRIQEPLRGCGALYEYSEMGSFGIRLVMHYQPESATQRLWIGADYGCGVLQNKLGVQVNS